MVTTTVSVARLITTVVAVTFTVSPQKITTMVMVSSQKIMITVTGYANLWPRQHTGITDE